MRLQCQIMPNLDSGEVLIKASVLFKNAGEDVELSRAFISLSISPIPIPYLEKLFFFFGLMSVSFYITEFFGRGVTGNFPSMVRSGQLDTLRLRPRGTLTQVLSSGMDPRRIPKPSSTFMYKVFTFSATILDLHV